MLERRTTLTALALTLAAAPIAAAGIVAEEDFEGVTNIVSDTFFTRADTGVTLSTSGDPFGLGSGNQYVRHEDSSSTAGRVAGALDTLGALDNGVFSINFLFVEPTTTNRNDVISFRVGNTTNSPDVSISLSFDDGTLGSSEGAYLLDTVYAVDVVANESGATVHYAEGNSVANNTYDVFVTTALGVTTLVLNDVAFSNTGQNLDSVYFQSFSSALQLILYDNITITGDEAIIRGIPEPTSIALTLAGLALMIRRRGA